MRPMSNLNVPGLDLRAHMQALGERARGAAREMARAPTRAKNAALENIAAALVRDSERLLEANADDVDAARRAGCDESFVDRLTLKTSTISSMAEGLHVIAALPDPVGELSDLRYRPTGIQVGKMRVP